MISVSKNFVYESGIIIFDIRDYGTSVFLKLSSKLLFLKSIKLRMEEIDSCATYADLFARKYELGTLKRSYIYLKLSHLMKASFTFSDAGQNSLCYVDYTINGGIIQSRLLFCDIDNLAWMVSVADFLYRADLATRVKNYKVLIEGTEYEKLFAESSTG